MALFIYIIGIADGLKITAGIVGWGGALVMAIVGFFLYVDNDNEAKVRAIKGGKKILGVCACLVAVSVFAPDSKTLAAMYVVPRVLENERISRVADGSLTVLEGYLKKWAEGLTETAPQPEEE